MAASGYSSYIVNYAAMRLLKHPVSGAGADVPIGTIMMPGATGGTNKGVLIPCTATSTARAVGLLAELHDYSVVGDALTQTLTRWFEPPAAAGGSSYLNATVGTSTAPVPSHQIDLLDTFTAIKLDYNLASTLAVASATSTVLTITSEVANQDSSFVYVNAGTGIGQLGFISQSASGSLTLISALTTTLDSTSRLTKVMPLYWEQATLTINTASVPTLIASVPGITSSGARTVSLANFININGLTSRLDPLTFHNYQSLNSVTSLNFNSYLAMQDSEFHPIS